MSDLDDRLGLMDILSKQKSSSQIFNNAMDNTRKRHIVVIDF